MALRAPSNPNTERQQVQRAKFGFITKELNGLRNLFQVIFGRARAKNDAISYAMKTALSGKLQIHPAKIIHNSKTQSTHTY